MPKFLIVIAAIVLVLHGLIHLLGTIVYMRLGAIDGFPYKTALLGGLWDLGESGMRVFGALWVVAAFGFVLASAALMAGWGWWKPVLVGVTLFSLALTILDFRIAFAGVVTNVLILAVVWLGPLFANWLSR